MSILLGHHGHMKDTDGAIRSSWGPSAVPEIVVTEPRGPGSWLCLNVWDAELASKVLGMGDTSIILVAKCALPESLVPAFGKTVGFYCDTV